MVEDGLPPSTKILKTKSRGDFPRLFSNVPPIPVIKNKKRCSLPDSTENVFQDVRAKLVAALGAERITTKVIRGAHLGAGHGRPARMSASYAGISWYIDLGCER